MMVRFAVPAMTIVLAMAFAVPCSAAPMGADIFAASSDGHGTVSLTWFPAPARLRVPAFRLFESRNGVERAIADRILPGDPAYAGTISARDFAFAHGLTDGFRKARSTGRTERAAMAVAIKVLSDFRFAQVAGFARVLRAGDAGTRRYRVVELDEQGAPTSIAWSSPPVDPGVTSPGLAVPQGLRARVGREGIALGWAPPARASAAIVLAYRVERGGTDITPIPVVLGDAWTSETQFTDRGVARNADATYRVVAVDVLGRRSAPSAPATVYAMDVAALDPPQLTLRREGMTAVLSWVARPSHSVAGYVVQRATMPFGPFDTLTPRGLSATTTQYADTATSAGTSYFYRIAAMSPRGDLGPPSALAPLAVARGPVPEPPSELRATGGATRVRLTWRDPRTPIAGVEIERRTARGDWVRISQLPVAGERYDDRIGQGTGEAIAYRATALGRDGQRSQPTAAVTAAMPDTRVPGAPSLLEAVAQRGAVHLEFRGPTGAATGVTYAVYRSNDARAPGVAIARDLPATTTAFDDRSGTPGSRAAYRVRAIGPNGAQGPLSDAMETVASASTIPTPPAAAAVYVRAPFRHIDLRFARPPAGLFVAVFAPDEHGRLRRVAWNVAVDHATDAQPRHGKTTYTLAFQDAAGRRGAFSPGVEVGAP